MDIIALDRNKYAPPDFETSLTVMADWCRGEIKRREACGHTGGRPRKAKKQPIAKLSAHCPPDPPPEVSESPLTKAETLDGLRDLMGLAASGVKASEIYGDTNSYSDRLVDAGLVEWIEDPQTFENGEILYWHHKPKQKPVCYKRETDWTSA